MDSEPLVVRERAANWRKVPDLESFSEFYTRKMSARKKPASAAHLLPAQKVLIHRRDVVQHPHKSLDQLRNMYERRGFNTRVLLQSYRPNPTAARPIGFSFNFPRFRELAKWDHRLSALVLRLHLDILKWGSCLCSLPHIEPDPKFHPADHLKCAAAGDEITAGVAVKVLKHFLTQ